MAQAKAAANRIMSIRPVPDDNKSSAVLDQCEGGVEIEFKSVNFKYPSRDVPIFKSLSFTVCLPVKVLLPGLTDIID